MSSLQVRQPHDVEIEEIMTAAAVAVAYVGHCMKRYLAHGFRIMKAVSELQEMAGYVQRQAAQSLLGSHL